MLARCNFAKAMMLACCKLAIGYLVKPIEIQEIGEGDSKPADAMFKSKSSSPVRSCGSASCPSLGHLQPLVEFGGQRAEEQREREVVGRVLHADFQVADGGGGATLGYYRRHALAAGWPVVGGWRRW